MGGGGGGGTIQTLRATNCVEYKTLLVTSWNCLRDERGLYRTPTNAIFIFFRLNMDNLSSQGNLLFRTAMIPIACFFSLFIYWLMADVLIVLPGLNYKQTVGKLKYIFEELILSI